MDHLPKATLFRLHWPVLFLGLLSFEASAIPILAAGDQVSAEARVNSSTIMRLPAETIRNAVDFQGVSVSAARVYNTLKEGQYVPESSMRVSHTPTANDVGNKEANAAESVALDHNLEMFRAVARQAGSPFYEGKVAEAAGVFRTSLAPRKSPAQFEEVSKEVVREVRDPEPDGPVIGFDYIGLFAKTENLQNNIKNRLSESALAVAGQKRLTENYTKALPDVSHSTILLSKTESLKKGASAEAVAIAQNRDPFGVEWAGTSRRIDIELTGLSLFAATSGAAAKALAWYGVDGSVIDGTSSVSSVTEDSELNRFLYSLDILLYAYGGETFSYFNLTLGSGVAVSDNHGYAGVDALSNLGSLLASNDFALPDYYRLSFDFGPSIDTNDPLHSVIFIREAGSVASMVVPEPDSLLLIGVAAALALWPGQQAARTIRRRRSWKDG